MQRWNRCYSTAPADWDKMILEIQLFIDFHLFLLLSDKNQENFKKISKKKKKKDSGNLISALTTDCRYRKQTQSDVAIVTVSHRDTHTHTHTRARTRSYRP